MDENGTTPRVAVVTGAGSGIGRAVARKLLAEGWNVALAGRREEPLRETAREAVPETVPETRLATLIDATELETSAEASRAGGTTLVVPCDVTRPPDVERLFAETIRAFGRVDVLFNNAGTFGPAGDVGEIDVAGWEATVAVNLTGSFLCAAAAFRAMKAQAPQGGRIINNGSISAYSPRPKSVVYTTTKHAITGLTKSIELDGRPYGITAGQIDIGNTRTEMMYGIGVGVGALQADGSRRVEPTFDVAEAANAVAFMASLPREASVGSLLITAAGMPFVGRG